MNLQSLLDNVRDTNRTYVADIRRETFSAVRDAAKHLYTATQQSLANGNTVCFTGKTLFRTHRLRPEYIENMSLQNAEWILYVDWGKHVHCFSLTAVDEVKDYETN